MAFLIFSCNSDKQKNKREEVEVDKCFNYPFVIDSLHLKELYDSARWYIYALQCDEKYLPKSDTTKSISFGELPLKFEELVIKNDTLNINFSFMDRQEPILFSMNRSGKSIIAGVGFNMKTKSKMYMTFPGGSVVYMGGDNRYENPMQPEVIMYIKKNWNVINDCFKELAISNGIKP